jgi:hypothetical protein
VAWTRLDVALASNPFRYWLIATIVRASLSLVVDAVDVIRDLKSERDPYVKNR